MSCFIKWSVISLIFCGMIRTSCCDAQTVSLDEIAELALDREVFLRSLSVEANVKAFVNENDSELGTYTLTLDEERIRCTASWGGSDSDFAFADGTATRVRGSDGRYSTALITNDPNGAQWATPIRRFLTEIYSVDASEYCRDIANTLSEAGRNVQVEVIREQDDKQLDFKVVAVFDTELNLALTRVDRFVRRKGEAEWYPQSICHMLGFENYGQSGFFVPTKAVYKLFTMPESKGDTGIALVHNEFKFSNWVIPAEIASDTFAITIEPDTNVQDRVRNVKYIKTNIGEREILSQLDAVNSGSWKSNRYFLGFSSLLFVSLVVVLYTKLNGAKKHV